jgi:hypothetical protein
MKDDPEAIRALVIGKHIETVKSSKTQAELRLDLGLREGGTLIIMLSRPSDTGWPVMLSRRPHEVCMRWIDSDGGHHFCCGGGADNERMFAAELVGREIKDVASHEGALRLQLENAGWTPYIEWITGQSAFDRLPTHYQWIYVPSSSSDARAVSE